MSWYVMERLKVENTNQATLEEMQQFLTLWNCVCGTCPVCKACLEVVHLQYIEEEE